MSLRLAWSRHGGDDCLLVTGWSQRALGALRDLSDDDLARRVVVYPTDVVVRAGSSNVQPVIGRYHRDTDAIAFVPRFPFLPDRSYTVLVDHRIGGIHRGGGDRDTVATFGLEDFERLTIARPGRAGGPRATVLAIHPTAAAIPRNQLRCYVHFSAPMSEGFATTHVRVVRAGSHEAVDGALLAMEPELWDPERRRLTVLFDPARIKRGLAPHRDAGYALLEGVPVELVVDEEFRDADGRPLAESSSRRYDVVADVRSLVDPSRWRVHPPPASTREPLFVQFDRPLDHALLGHCLTVSGPRRRTIGGRVSVPPGEASWTFTPVAPWAPVAHALTVDPILEDLAGNSVVRVFDRDLADPGHTPLAIDHVTMEFHPS